jgi:hypothetical protein
MNARRDPDRLINAFLMEGQTELADPVYDAVRATIEHKRQRVVIGPWRFPDMNKLVPLGIGIAAVAVAVFVGGQLLAAPAPGGAGAVPSVQPSPTPAPTVTPAPTATLVAEATPAPIPADGFMRAGTYVTHPLPAPDDALALTFTVPAGWYGFGDRTIYADEADGTALQFIGVTALNSDLCRWADPKGEVDVGTTVDDLVAALVAQTKYEVSDPVDVSIGGYSGKRVDVVFPAKLFKEKGSGDAPGCDEGRTHLFGDGGIYGQGPDERWQNNILDVDGTRFVIIVQDDPDTSAADRAGTAAIVDSMVIEP